MKDTGYVTYTKLFDAGVLSILNYGAEVWGHGKYPKCDLVMNKAMRHFLGVHKFAPTAAVQGDMGWMSLKFHRYIAMLRFWNRMLKINNTRLVKRICVWCYDNPEHNWSNDVAQIAQLLNVENAFVNKLPFDIPDIKNRCMEQMKNEWKNALTTKPKLRTYIQFKTEFKVEPYEFKSIPKNKRSLFAQFRCGILPLAIETGRFRNKLDLGTKKFRKTKIEERLCTICNNGCVEDECQFLFYCNTYDIESKLLFDQCSHTNLDLFNNSNQHKLTNLMNVNWHKCIEYIMKAWNTRKDVLFI